MAIEFKLGKLSVESGGSEKLFIDGEFAEVPGITAAQLRKSLIRKDDPYHDYFIFSLEKDPSTVYLMKTDANSFSGEKEKRHQFKLFGPNELGTLAEIEGVEYAHRVDNSWDYPVRELEVAILGADGRELNEFEKRLVTSFSERVEGRIRDRIREMDGVLTAQLIRDAISDIEVEMMEVSLGHKRESLEIEVIDDPEGGDGEKAVKVKFTVAAAPESISFAGFPKGIRERAIEFFDRRMREVFEDHPLITSRRMADIDGRLDYELVREELEDGSVVWRYPPNMPEWDNSVTDRFRELTAFKKRDRVPDAKPNGTMPIPANVYIEFIQEFVKDETFEGEPGIYELVERWSFGDRTARIAVVRSDRPQYYLTDETVRVLKESAGIDLSEEKAKLDEGTADWSRERTRRFFEGISAKFKAVGQDLLLDDRDFPLMKFDFSRGAGAGSVEISLNTKPLIKPGQIVFAGDVDIPGIDVEDLKEIIGDKPLGRMELDEKLLEIEEYYHKEGYRLVGEDLFFTEGLQILQSWDGRNERLMVSIAVVRMGKVDVSGNIPEKSRVALEAALSSREGAPLRTDDLKSLRRAMEKHNLVLSEKPVCVQRRDGAFDINVAVERELSEVGGGVDVNTMGVGLTGRSVLRHIIPGFSEAGIEGTVGYFYADEVEGRDAYESLFGGVGVRLKSVPVNDRGVYLVNGMSFFRSPYAYWSAPDELDEAGDAERGSASVEVHIPLGSKGIASPFELWVGLSGDIVHREGIKVPTESDVDRIDGYVGEDVGVQAFLIDLIKENDSLINTAIIGFNENVVDGASDVTVKGSVRYNMPLGEYFMMKTVLAASKRVPFYDGDLLPERMFPGIPYIDFGQAFGEMYVADYYWHSGLFVYLTLDKMKKIFQPAVGATVSSDCRKKVHGGGGIVLSLVPAGLSLYVGANQDGKLSFGIR